jgi:hypothetical protein
MTLDKVSGKVNDPALSWDDAILCGAVGSEGLDQLIPLVQRDNACEGWKLLLPQVRVVVPDHQTPCAVLP